MCNNKVTVLVVEPLKKPYVAEIERGLRPLQEAVGGYIQAIYPFEEPVAIVCDEEAKLIGKPLNRALRDEDGHIYDIVAGTFLLVGIADDDFDSLPDEYLARFSQRFDTLEMFLNVGDKIVVLPAEEN